MDYIILILVFILLFFIFRRFNNIESFTQNKEIPKNISKKENIKNIEIKNNRMVKKEHFEIGCNTDDDCNIVNGGGKNICKSDHKCYCIVGTGDFCQLGSTNFKNPEAMTLEELKSFKENYSKEKFSLQDYKNWLLLHKENQKELSQDHLNNLKNINKLKEKDIPRSKISPPETAADYFNKMYKENLEMIIEPLNSDTAGIVLASNFSDYSEFIPPKDITNYVIKNTDYKQSPISVDQCFMKITK
jgi:hypothetical protein